MFKYSMINKKKRLICLLSICIINLFLLQSNIYGFGKSDNKDDNEESIFINEKKTLKHLFKRVSGGSRKSNENDESCFSAFDSLNKINLNLYDTNRKTNCSNQDWVFFDIQPPNDRGVFTFNYDYLNGNNIQIDYCQYSTVGWYENDFQYKLNEMKNFKNGTILNGDGDLFIYATCRAKNSNRQYKTAYARILKSKESKELDKEPLNVFMLGFDSVSRSQWRDSLPRSTNYFINSLNATVLNGYNIVGDGTPAALIPILTGKHEEELPNTIKNSVGSKYVDKAYPFIWKEFKNRFNYSTLFVEDWPSSGTFNYRMVGMEEPPVDNYMRPFELFLDKENILEKNTHGCLNGRSQLSFHLDYAKDFMSLNQNTGFFGMMFIAEYSHDSTGRLSMADDDLYKFLVDFNENKRLNENTILILFSDHGPRFSSNRKSIKGLLEERNPFFSIYLPSRFEQKYKSEYETLKINANKLSTPMDIYHTLMDLVNMESSEDDEVVKIDDNDRSSSLFKYISANRSCYEAGISQHWCACLKRTELVVDDNLNMIANKFLDYLNDNLLKDHLNECVRLELDKINKVYLLDSIMGSAKKPVVEKTLLGYFRDLFKFYLVAPKVEKDYEQYFFQITTRPNNAIFEFTVVYEFDLNQESLNNLIGLEKLNVDKFIIKENSISRINKYGNDPHCIYEKFPDLRKYCFCKN